MSEEEAREEAKSSIYHDFDLPEELLWENIRKKPARLPEKFSQALKAIAERNPELKGKEKAIKAGILKDDLIECVILLPEKLFYNTGAPGAILILNNEII